MLTPNVPPGKVYLIIGVYLSSTGERLPLIDQTIQVIDDKIVLTSLEITPPR